MPKAKPQPRFRIRRQGLYFRTIVRAGREKRERIRFPRQASFQSRPEPLLIWSRLKGRQFPGIHLHNRHDVGSINGTSGPILTRGFEHGKMSPGKAVLPEGNDQLDVEPDHPVWPLAHRLDGIDDENLPGIEQGTKAAGL